ncbi:MAG TPA: cell division FtsA domain-containing protein [Candidatus Saccharibacteria bacterium]|jgi:cell division protein FtsA|nr:cell division FtsA domain-containing protein [Candidatus Saccharibacteria bacterium]HMR38266.1 cell division FtsA domain-containing protein [Candidatus Saccharibacteria bacterium]
MSLKNIFTFTNQNTTKNLLVGLDIGTENVKALIARVANGSLEVIGVGRTHQGMGDMYGGAIADITSVVRNCEDALAQAEEEAGLQAKQAVIGIAGELVKGVTNTIRYRRPQPDKPLDIAEMEFIIEKVQERAAQKAQKQIALETGNEDVEVKLVNSALVSIHIDGYKVTNPVGFQGKDVAVQIYTAFAPMIHIGALEKVADELALDLIAVAAEPFAVSRSVLGDDANSNFTAILADVGGGTTDIAVVNDGGVEGTKMFGIGGRSFTRTIANELGVGYEEAEKLKLNLSHEKIKPDVKKVAMKAIDKTLEVWLDGVELALSEFDTVDHLPSKLLLCGGGASLEQLVEALSEQKWYEELPFSHKPKVQLVKPSDIVGIVDQTGKVNDHTFITATGLLRVGCDTIESNDTDSVKDKINKILRI